MQALVTERHKRAEVFQRYNAKVRFSGTPARQASAAERYRNMAQSKIAMHRCAESIFHHYKVAIRCWKQKGDYQSILDATEKESFRNFCLETDPWIG